MGLVVAVANSASLSTHLVTRKGSEWVRDEYHLELTGDPPIRLRVADCSEAEKFAELKAATQTAIQESGGESMVITSAAGAALVRYADLIVEVAERRVAIGGGETVFIPCENNPGDACERLVKRLRKHGVDCRPTMVNRLCPRRLKLGESAVVVQADPYAEWVIQGSCDGGALTDLQPLPVVSFVPDVEPFCVRKRWLVNGGHLALGLTARLREQPSIRTVARDREAQAQLQDLQGDMIESLPQEWTTVLGDSAAYGTAQIVPFCRTEDDTRRILSRLKRADLRPFMEDANLKLGTPARTFRQRFGCESPRFREVFKAIHKVLLNLNHYEDADEVREGAVELDSGSDSEAIEAYKKLLEGVVSNEIVGKRVATLRSRLADHHA